MCHGSVVDASLAFVDPSLHINGRVDATGGSSCTSCHGSGDNSAPPSDTLGQSDTFIMGVGAHQPHLASSSWHRTVVCSECHVVPSAVDDPGHIDELPAEMTWTGVATADGADPSFDHDAGTCSSVYCHGGTLIAGGDLTEPVWNVVDGTQAACGTCHGLPPGPTHPDSLECSVCHGDVVDDSLGFVAPERHVDGTVDVIGSMACNACHGGADNPAPPVDTSGENDTSLMTVGAHQPHVEPSDWHRTVACGECHVVPSSAGDSGHVDAFPAETVWSGVAVADSASPAFDRTDGTCSSVYCHGPTLISGGTITEPVWNTVDGSQAACGTCHGIPPAAPHTTSTACETCHASVIGPSMTWVDKDRHINGTVDF
jgi:predicted CxxxxCH...CXXCH cytochrome family protein